jgi:hypothetical protein
MSQRTADALWPALHPIHEVDAVLADDRATPGILTVVILELVPSLLNGGSAIVMFGEPGKWRPFDALLEHTKRGVETLARLGEPICLGTSREM